MHNTLRTAWPRPLWFGLGALLGTVSFLLLYGAATLDVTNDAWIYSGYVEEDIIQQYTGWMFFRAAPWGWPPAVAGNLAVPYGTSVAFTDSIPALAVFFKLLSPILPATFQYTGWYMLVCCALQGGFAMLLFWHFKLGRAYALIAALLLIGLPVFLERVFRHGSLASQWVLLAALLCYFTARRARGFTRRAGYPLLGFLLLCALAPAIHTYFVPMVYALLAAALAGHIAASKKPLRPLVFLALCLAATAAAAYALGLLTRGGDGGAMGYGEYSLNLNALFNPRSLDLYAEGGVRDWSAVLPTLGQLPKQYDGFNYLGLGLLLAWLAMAVYGVCRLARAGKAGRRALFERAGRFLLGHAWLLAVCLCLTVFALSHVVAFGDNTLFAIPMPGLVLQVAAVFRASGRLFWPCGYLLALCPVVFGYRALRGRWRMAGIAALAAVQLLDTAPAFRDIFTAFHPPRVAESAYTGGDLAWLMASYDDKQCMAFIEDYNLAAAMIRFNPDTTTNFILANRGVFHTIYAGWHDINALLTNGEALPDNTLYICTDEHAFFSILQNIHPEARGYTAAGYYFFANPLPGCPLRAYQAGEVALDG